MRSYEMTEIGERGLKECLTEAFGIAMDSWHRRARASRSRWA